MNYFSTCLALASLVALSACTSDRPPGNPGVDTEPSADTIDAGPDLVVADTDVAPDSSDVGPDTALDTPDSEQDVRLDIAPETGETGVPDPRETGEDCRDSEDCESGLCIVVAAGRSVCSNECDAGCQAGWTCLGAICQCGAGEEICDGLDNDCDAHVDEGGAELIGCPAGGVCDAGVCGCPSDELICDDGCFDSMTSNEHCGGCDQACSPGDLCIDGYCPCLSGDETRCDSLCTDLTSDVDNCGGCGVSCGFGVCDEGACICGEPETSCESGCADVATDWQNCGACGTVCGDDQVCVAGACECGCPDASCADGACLPLGFGNSLTLEFEFNGAALRTDIVFNIDTTGSMGPSIEILDRDFDDGILLASRDAFEDPAFALTSFADFPCVWNGSGGSGRDVPMRLEQRITAYPSQLVAALGRLRAAGGRDIPETGIEALYQIATGVGSDECRPGIVAPFDPRVGRIEGVADGVAGGVGFREGAQPIVFHLTDAPSHAREDEQYKFGATEPEAIAALQEAGIRVVGLFTIDDALEDLEAFIAETGAAAPTCAWDAARHFDCSPGECCTWLGRSGTEPDSTGRCPLGYYVRRGFLNEDDLTDVASDAYRVLTQHVGRDVVIRAVSNREAADPAFDTRCLIEELRIVETASSGECRPETITVDVDADGVTEAATGVTAATTVRVEVDVNNTCANDAGAYPVHFELTGTDGVLLGEESVAFFVR